MNGIFFSKRTKDGYMKKSELLLLGELRDLSECHFNKIELRCPKCHITQEYSNTELCGDAYINCDFCSFSIPFKYDNFHDWNNELGGYITRPTVINRI